VAFLPTAKDPRAKGPARFLPFFFFSIFPAGGFPSGRASPREIRNKTPRPRFWAVAPKFEFKIKYPDLQLGEIAAHHKKPAWELRKMETLKKSFWLACEVERHGLFVGPFLGPRPPRYFLRPLFPHVSGFRTKLKTPGQRVGTVGKTQNPRGKFESNDSPAPRGPPMNQKNASILRKTALGPGTWGPEKTELTKKTGPARKPGKPRTIPRDITTGGNYRMGKRLTPRKPGLSRRIYCPEHPSAPPQNEMELAPTTVRRRTIEKKGWPNWCPGETVKARLVSQTKGPGGRVHEDVFVK